MKKSLWQHEMELEKLYIELEKTTNQQEIDEIHHAIFMKAAFIDQNFFENIPLENIDPNDY
jgi:hypothetical protein